MPMSIDRFFIETNILLRQPAMLVGGPRRLGVSRWVRRRKHGYGYVPAYDGAPDADAPETSCARTAGRHGRNCTTFPEFNYEGCDDCMAEAMAELARESAELKEVA
jgi:hypothetical protein